MPWSLTALPGKVGSVTFIKVILTVTVTFWEKGNRYVTNYFLGKSNHYNYNYFYVTLWTCFSGKSGIKNARIYWQYKSTIYKTKCAFGLSICLGNPSSFLLKKHNC